MPEDKKQTFIAALLKSFEEEAIKKTTMEELRRIRDLEKARKPARSVPGVGARKPAASVPGVGTITANDVAEDKAGNAKDDAKDDEKEDIPAESEKTDEGKDDGKQETAEDVKEDEMDTARENEGDPETFDAEGEETRKEDSDKESSEDEKETIPHPTARNGMGGLDELERRVTWLPNATIRTKMCNLFKSKAWPKEP